MANVVRANVNPEILVWAREQAAVSTTDAARKASVRLERLLSWEDGTSQPTLRQLRLLAKAYRRPSAFFYLASPPETPPELADFRRLPDRHPEKTPELLYEIRRARARRETAIEILAAIDDSIRAYRMTASVDEPTQTVAARLRSYLEISAEQQFEWSSPYEALKAWTLAAEAGGVLVSQFGGIGVGVIRGFSICETPLPVVALNAKDSPHGRIFTLLHELCHLAIGTGGLCDLHENDAGSSIESYCNAVAAEALVPALVLLRQTEVIYNPDAPHWREEILTKLSNRFRVSREVILRRLLSLGKTTRAFYQQKREEYQKEYSETARDRGGYIRYHKRVLRDNGNTYTSLVIDAYYQQVITAVDVSRYLGDIRLNHLGSIEHELRR